MSLISGGVISAIAAVVAGIVLSHVTGTSVRDGLRPLAPLRGGARRPPLPAPGEGRPAAA